MSVKTKIIIGITLLISMVFLLAGINLYGIMRQSELTDDANKIYQSSRTLSDRILDIVNLDADLRVHVVGNLALPPDDTWVRLSCVLINKRLIEWHKKYKTELEYSVLTPDQREKLEIVGKEINTIRDLIVQIRNEESNVKRSNLYEQSFSSVQLNARNKLTEIIDENIRQFRSKNISINDFVSEIKLYTYIIIGIALMFVIFTLLYTNYILRPINWLMEGVKKIKEGEMNFIVRKVSNDELGQLTAQFNEMHKEINNHRENLEELVQDRTEQLSSTNTKLIDTLDELQTTNRQLVEARRIAELDMKMAVNVQKSFLVKEAPYSDKWDVAFIFRPMSGVSGDMYDFYVNDDGQFIGLSLMDISGHGISSGLLSMIAKSVAQRNFKFGHENNLSLNRTIVKMNSELISELKNIDNYLTGIIMKFYDDVVEYVNAGHPDVIIRKSDRKRSFVVAPSKHDYKGKFLGLEPMYFNEKEIRPLKFKVQKGDILCLYTDCLNECLDPEGNEFGIEGIISALNTVDDSYSARDILDHLVRSFYSWNKSEDLKDDLSVIILRRK